MKKIKILGSCCANCDKLQHNAEQAARDAGVEYEIEKVSDIKEIMSYGAMLTPGLVIDGKLRSAGKVLSPADIKAFLK